MAVVTCSDFECEHYQAGQCIAPAVDHTADRFCVTGRRRSKDETTRLMKPDAGICQRDHGAMKRKR